MEPFNNWSFVFRLVLSEPTSIEQLRTWRCDIEQILKQKCICEIRHDAFNERHIYYISHMLNREDISKTIDYLNQLRSNKHIMNFMYMSYQLSDNVNNDDEIFINLLG